MKETLAQIPIGPLRGLGPLGNPGANAPTLFNNFISGAVGIMTGIAAIWFVFQFIIGALGIIAAGGDKAKIESARGKISTGIIGLIVVVAAIFLIDIIGGFLGLSILNPAEFIQNFVPGQ